MIELRPASVAGAGAPCGKEEPCLTILSLWRKEIYPQPVVQKKNLACGAKKLILSLWCKEIYPQIVVQKNHKFIQPRYDLHLFIFTFIQTKMPQPDSENFCL